MNEFNIVQCSLKIIFQSEVTHLLGRSNIGIISNKLNDGIPRATIYNLNRGYNEVLFDAPLSSCSPDGITPFTIDSFILYAETNFGVDCGSTPAGTSGTSGVNGTSGTSGTGTSGTSGVSGTSGISGTSGTSGTGGGGGGTSGTSGVNGTSGIDGTSGTSGVNGTSGISGTSGTSGANGTSGVNGGNGTSGTSGLSNNNLQKTITYPADFTGTDYTLLNGDDNYTILIDNGANDVTVTVPSGLNSKIQTYYIRQGSGEVAFVESSTTINSPSSKKRISEQNGWAYTEQVTNTNVYQLLGLLKT